MFLVFLSELIGTFVFISVILSFTTIDNGINTALCIGLTLAVAIWFTCKASLGALNPAVSLALFLRGDLDATKLIVYTLAQILAAFLALAWWQQIQAGWLLQDSSASPK